MVTQSICLLLRLSPMLDKGHIATSGMEKFKETEMSFSLPPFAQLVYNRQMALWSANISFKPQPEPGLPCAFPVLPKPCRAPQPHRGVVPLWLFV